jgi:hypothetical protein
LVGVVGEIFDLAGDHLAERGDIDIAHGLFVRLAVFGLAHQAHEFAEAHEALQGGAVLTV